MLLGALTAISRVLLCLMTTHLFFTAKLSPRRKARPTVRQLISWTGLLSKRISRLF